jgi:hypothetical protein
MSNKSIAIWLLVISGLIVLYLMGRVVNDGYGIWSGEKIEYGITGQIGDFIGGVIGTIFSAAGFYFLYLTLNEQRVAFINQRIEFKKERFESNFFDLVKLHRDNVLELKYRRFEAEGFQDYGYREIFKIIFEEFAECLHEVRTLSKSKDPDSYLLRGHQDKLRDIIGKINPRISLTEISLIDIAYSIVFFGVDKEGEIILRDRFKHKYRSDYFYPLIHYIQLKPKKQYVDHWRSWGDLNKLDRKKIVSVTKELYLFRGHIKNSTVSEHAKKVLVDGSFEPYYSGHQFRLGHYFRHLFQSYKYLNSQEALSENEKYFYGKTLRAQLSTYEQGLLFIDSISSLGMKWEYTPDVKKTAVESDEDFKKTIEDAKLITKFNLIKNLPGNHYFGLSYKLYYPHVKYEAKEHRL